MLMYYNSVEQFYIFHQFKSMSKGLLNELL